MVQSQDYKRALTALLCGVMLMGAPVSGDVVEGFLGAGRLVPGDDDHLQSCRDFERLDNNSPSDGGFPELPGDLLHCEFFEEPGSQNDWTRNESFAEIADSNTDGDGDVLRITDTTRNDPIRSVVDIPVGAISNLNCFDVTVSALASWGVYGLSIGDFTLLVAPSIGAYLVADEAVGVRTETEGVPFEGWTAASHWMLPDDPERELCLEGVASDDPDCSSNPPTQFRLRVADDEFADSKGISLYFWNASTSDDPAWAGSRAEIGWSWSGTFGLNDETWGDRDEIGLHSGAITFPSNSNRSSSCLLEHIEPESCNEGEQESSDPDPHQGHFDFLMVSECEESAPPPNEPPECGLLCKI